MCADGIDVLKDVNVEVYQELDLNKPLPPSDAARFAAAWMDRKYQEKVMQTVMSSTKTFDWESAIAHARLSPGFPLNLKQKCRSFSWYESEINHHLEQTQEDIDESEARRSRSMA
mmetsp:Transcript_17380/g.25104  ORF Transcript_17380/g.25104 Transcript_17380/m.25104 type:complete len:115 (+) Transcript_17380:1-345(+)